jgi:hypothetical protein
MYNLKRYLPISLFLVFIFTFITVDCDAQRRSSRRRVIETEDVYKENPIWWGINVGNLSVFNNQLSMGVAPMIGYKFTEALSVGAIAEISYFYVWRRDPTPNESYLDYGLGVFSRAKIADVVFAHVEFRKQNVDFETSREWRDYFYIGGGYTSGNGGLWAYEISLLYNVLDETNRIEFPFDYRIAFTYNF